MYIINAENVNDALDQGLRLMGAEGVAVQSRNGMTLELLAPVTTVYKNPAQRVLVSSARDANPFFHLMEALWIIAGRSDVEFLAEFNKRMGDYSDDGIEFNAPYGYRLRKAFAQDQIDTVIKTLTRDPNSRQAVCQIWDTEDLDKDTKDKACNMSIVFRIRKKRLDMVVYNRSNDMVWGAYGANVVQFSMLQEYVAAHLAAPVGTYTQVSNSFHVYTSGPGGEVFRRLIEGYDTNQRGAYNFISSMLIMTHSDIPAFEHDLKQFFKVYDSYGLSELGRIASWESEYFESLVLPMLNTYLVHKAVGPKEALRWTPEIFPGDWRAAARDWLQTRYENGRTQWLQTRYENGRTQ